MSKTEKWSDVIPKCVLLYNRHTTNHNILINQFTFIKLNNVYKQTYIMCKQKHI